MKYYNLQIAPLDESYLDELSETRWIERTDVDFERNWNWVITNAIIQALFEEIVYNNVEDDKDREKLIDSIYTNCLDSRFDIDEDELESEEAKEFIKNF
jgi:hypothetical protein